MFDYRIPVYWDNLIDSEQYAIGVNGITIADFEIWASKYNRKYNQSISINDMQHKYPVNLNFNIGLTKIYRTANIEIEPFVYPLHCHWAFISELTMVTDPSANTFYDNIKISPVILEKIRNRRCIILLFNSWEAWSLKKYRTIINKIISKYPIIKPDQFIVLDCNHDLDNQPDFTHITGNLCNMDHDDALYDIAITNIVIQKHKPYNFICLNRAPKINRYFALTMLFDYKDKGILSFLGSLPAPKLSTMPQNTLAFKQEWSKFVRARLMDASSDDYAMMNSFLSTYDNTEVVRKFISDNLQQHIPLLINENFDPRHNPNPDTDYQKFIDSSLNIVTETNFLSGSPVFITEKTYKAFKYLQPFVIMSTPRFLKVLKSRGYQTFSKWIDESYDDINDDYERAVTALNSSIKFFNRDQKEIAQDIFEMKDILQHNYWNMMQEINSHHVYVLTALMWFTQHKVERYK